MPSRAESFAHFGPAMGRRRTFLPRDIRGCVLTLDGSSNVTTWADQSGNGHDATQATPLNRVPWTSSGINGLPSLAPDLSSRSLVLPNLSAVLTSAAERFFVAKSTHAGADNAIEDAIGISGGITLWPYGDGSIYDGFCSSTRASYAPGVTMLNTPHIYDTVSAAGEFTCTIDGSQKFTRGTNAFACRNGTSTICGSSVDGVDTFPGLVSEWIIFNRKLTTTERTKVEHYLSGRYGIAVS